MEVTQKKVSLKWKMLSNVLYDPTELPKGFKKVIDINQSHKMIRLKEEFQEFNEDFGQKNNLNWTELKKSDLPIANYALDKIIRKYKFTDLLESVNNSLKRLNK